MTATPRPWAPLDEQLQQKRCHVPTLVQLCLLTIGKQLKLYINMSHCPPTLPPLTDFDMELIHQYDLSRLELFENDQHFLDRIAHWREKWRLKKQHAYHKNPKNVSLFDFIPSYALMTNLDADPAFQRLQWSLQIEPPPKLELRKDTPVKENRKPWKDPIEALTLADELQSVSLSTEANQPVENEVIELVRERASVTNVGCTIVAQEIASPSSLIRLCLVQCQITDAGAILLASAIRTSAVLQVLDLSNKPQTTEKSSMYNNEIACDGTQALALALHHHTSLHSLSLSGNPVGTNGGLALASAIRRNSTMRRLELERTHVRDAGEQLIDAFAESKSLKVMNLLWCSLRPGLGDRLLDVISAKSCFIQKKPDDD